MDAVTAPASLEGPEQLPVLTARGRSLVTSGFPAESTSDHNHVREGELFSVFHFFFGFKLASRKQLKQTSQFSAFSVILFHLGPRGPVCIEVGLASRWPFWPQPSLGGLL